MSLESTFPDSLRAKLRAIIAERYEIDEEQEFGTRLVFWIHERRLIPESFEERNHFTAKLSRQFGYPPYNLATSFYFTRFEFQMTDFIYCD